MFSATDRFIHGQARTAYRLASPGPEVRMCRPLVGLRKIHPPHVADVGTAVGSAAAVPSRGSLHPVPFCDGLSCGVGRAVGAVEGEGEDREAEHGEHAGAHHDRLLLVSHVAGLDGHRRDGDDDR